MRGVRGLPRGGLCLSPSLAGVLGWAPKSQLTWCAWGGGPGCAACRAAVMDFSNTFRFGYGGDLILTGKQLQG